jgi:hypothetical protein
MRTRTALPDAECGCPRYEDVTADGTKHQGCGHTPKCKIRMEARARAIVREEKAKRKKKV